MCANSQKSSKEKRSGLRRNIGEADRVKPPAGLLLFKEGYIDRRIGEEDSLHRIHGLCGLRRQTHKGFFAIEPCRTYRRNFFSREKLRSLAGRVRSEGSMLPSRVSTLLGRVKVSKLYRP